MSGAVVPDTFLWIIAKRGQALTFYVLYLHFLNLAEKVGGKDEIIQAFVGRGKDVIFTAFPFFMPFVDIDDFLSDAHYGIHIVGIDEGSHVVFSGDILYQFVDDERCFRVQTGVGFVAKEILRVQGNCSCNG